MSHSLFGPSSLGRRLLCSASYQEELKYENIEEIKAESPEEAESGDRCHLALKTMNFDGLKDIELEMVKRSLKIITQDEVGCDFSEHELPITITNKKGEIVSYGTLDFVAINKKEDYACAEDWKTGFLPVSAAHENIQVAAYAVGIHQRYGVSRVNAGIFQARWNKYDTFQFTNFDAIVENIEKIIADCKAPNPKYNPGEACKYCRAKLSCPAHKAELEKYEPLTSELPVIPDKELSEWYKKGKIVAKRIELINDEVKRRIREQGECAGLVFKEQSNGYGIKDVQRIFIKFSHLITFPEYAKLLTASEPDVRDLIVGKLIELAAKSDEKLTKKAAIGVYETVAGDDREPKEPKKLIVEIGNT